MSYIDEKYCCVCGYDIPPYRPAWIICDSCGSSVPPNIENSRTPRTAREIGISATSAAQQNPHNPGVSALTSPTEGSTISLEQPNGLISDLVSSLSIRAPCHKPGDSELPQRLGLLVCLLHFTFEYSKLLVKLTTPGRRHQCLEQSHLSSHL